MSQSTRRSFLQNTSIVAAIGNLREAIRDRRHPNADSLEGFRSVTVDVGRFARELESG